MVIGDYSLKTMFCFGTACSALKSVHDIFQPIV